MLLLCCVQVDHCLLADQLTKLAAKRGCKNRACVYRLLNRSVRAVHLLLCLQSCAQNAVMNLVNMITMLSSQYELLLQLLLSSVWFKSIWCVCRIDLNKFLLKINFIVYHVKKCLPIIFVLVKNEPILIIFGAQSPEKIWHEWFCVCPPHLRNVTTLPCEMQHSFSWSKLYCFLPKKWMALKNSQLLCCIESWISYKQYLWSC